MLTNIDLLKNVHLLLSECYTIPGHKNNLLSFPEGSEDAKGTEDLFRPE